MAEFQSHINVDSKEFSESRGQMLALVEKLRELSNRASETSERRRSRFEERGQLTPRERLSRLLDPGMPFLELFNMANYLVESDDPDTSIPGGNVIAGIGFVSGSRCMIYVDDSGISAGTVSAMSIEKICRILDIALKMKLPLIHLVESGGGDLMQYKVEMWSRSGGMYYRLARLSAAGIPTFAILHGPSTAGGAYMPGLSDYVIGVKGRGRAALAGSALVKAATGEIADDEELSGAEMHATTTGLVEYLAEDDAHGLIIARDLVERLQWNSDCERPIEQSFKQPLYDPDEIAGVVPSDYKKPYDVRELIARIVDGSDFVEFKPGYGSATVTVHASIFGRRCGIIGNNGPIDPNGATKAAHFFQLCDQANTPIVFLSNTTGYIVGTESEQAGMIKHGSKMVQAASNVRVPRITLYIGASFGAGNFGMCGAGYDPDFIFAWPNARTGVMGGEQAAQTMTQVMEASARRRGKTVDKEDLKEQEVKLKQHFDSQSGAFYTSGRLLDQGIIDPRDTRNVLGFALETCWESRQRKLCPNSFGVARL